MARKTAAMVTVMALAVGLPAPVAAAGEPEPGEETVVAGTGQGGDSGDGSQATNAQLGSLLHADFAGDGTLYIADTENRRVRRVDEDGVITTLPGSRADDNYQEPWALAAANDGSIYVASSDDVRRFRPDGKVETLARDTATTNVPLVKDIAVGADGVVYLLDSSQLFRMDRNGQISELGGEGSIKDPDRFDGKAVTDVALSLGDYGGVDIDTDSAGRLYVANRSGVWRVGAGGKLRRILGGGEVGYSGDGGPAVDAQVSDYVGIIAVDDDDNLYVADAGNRVVRKVDSSGRIETVAPIPRSGRSMTVAPNGDLYFPGRAAVRRVSAGLSKLGGPQKTTTRSPVADAEPGTVRVVADEERDMGPVVGPNGELYLVGDRAVKTGHGGEFDRVRAQIDGGIGASAVGADGALYVVAGAGEQIYRVRPGRTPLPVAGRPYDADEEPAVTDGRPAISARLGHVEKLVGAPDGELVVVAAAGVYRITRDGMIKTVASRFIDLDAEQDSIAVGPRGEIYVAREYSVVRIDRDDRRTTVAGTGEASKIDEDDIGDGAPATEARVAPYSIALDGDGVLYIGGYDGIHRVRDGVIDTVLENPPDADGRREPKTRLAFSPEGDLYFFDTADDKIKVLANPGEISGPFPWSIVLWIGGGVVALVAGWFWLRRRRAEA